MARILMVIAALAPLLALAACDVAYRPGVDGSKPLMMQNLRSNAMPEAPGARPR